MIARSAWRSHGLRCLSDQVYIGACITMWKGSLVQRVGSKGKVTMLRVFTKEPRADLMTLHRVPCAAQLCYPFRTNCKA